jgi:hypothetical protein
MPSYVFACRFGQRTLWLINKREGDGGKRREVTQLGQFKTSFPEAFQIFGLQHAHSESLKPNNN